MGFPFIFTIHFGGLPPLFLETSIYCIGVDTKYCLLGGLYATYHLLHPFTGTRNNHWTGACLLFPHVEPCLFHPFSAASRLPCCASQSTGTRASRLGDTQWWMANCQAEVKGTHLEVSCTIYFPSGVSWSKMTYAVIYALNCQCVKKMAMTKRCFGIFW